MTGTRSGYLARMRSASDFRFSVNDVRGRAINNAKQMLDDARVRINISIRIVTCHDFEEE